MNNACPECGAVYAVAEKDIGRRIACKKCNTALFVAEDGLRRDEDDDRGRKRERNTDEDDDRGRKRERGDEDVDRGGKKREPDDENDDRGGKKRGRDEDDDRGSRRDRSGRRGRSETSAGASVGEFFKKLGRFADAGTWLYSFGLVLTIYSFFAPRIDQANIEARDGAIMQAAADDAYDQRETDLKNDGKPSDNDRKEREKRKKTYETSEKPRLAEKKIGAEASAKQAHWWNTMYRLIGFSLLAFGSILYLSESQSNLKRILGGATLVLILLQVIGGGVGVILQAGGGPGPRG